MGDNKKMYVPKEILDVYKNDIINLTDILTPNEYELELEKLLFIKNFNFEVLIIQFLFFLHIRLLSGKTITTCNDIYEAMDILYAKGCKTIVVSSSNLSSNTDIKCIGRNVSSKYYLIYIM